MLRRKKVHWSYNKKCDNEIYNIKKHQNHKKAMWVDEQPTPSSPGAWLAVKTSFP